MSKTIRQDSLPTIEPTAAEPSISEPFVAPVAADAGAPERRALRQQVLALSWPVIIENLLQSLIGFVDTAFVGHLGTEALAGVGGAQQIVWLVNTLLAGVTMGATVLVARAIGGQNPGEARRVFKQSLLLAAGVA